MITLLAPLGTKFRLQFVPEYSGDGTVTVAVIYSPKDDEDAVPKSLTFSGTLAEVEEALVKELPAAVEKLVKHRLAIEELDAELAKELEAKKAEIAKDKEAAKKREEVKAVEKAAKSKGKGKGEPLTSVATPPEEAPEITPESAAAPVVPPVPTGLQPAWKAKAAAAGVEVVETTPSAEDPSALDWSALTGEQ